MSMYVFTYGSLKKGFHNHGIVADSVCLGTTATEEKYDMFSFGDFPAVIDTEAQYQIQGEVYKIDKKTLSILDMLEGNGSFYERKLVKVVGFDFDVWMYFIKDESEHTGNMDNIDIKDDIMFWKNIK